MATVIGIFEDAFKRNKPLPVVLPGSQSRRFTHIDDTIKNLLHGLEKVFQDIIQFLTNKAIQFYKLLECWIKDNLS